MSPVIISNLKMKDLSKAQVTRPANASAWTWLADPRSHAFLNHKIVLAWVAAQTNDNQWMKNLNIGYHGCGEFSEDEKRIIRVVWKLS